MSIFTRAFWVNALERAMVAFGGTLAVAPVFTGHATPGLTSIEAALINAALAAGYAFVKTFGAAQTVNFLATVAKDKPAS